MIGRSRRRPAPQGRTLPAPLPCLLLTIQSDLLKTSPQSPKKLSACMSTSMDSLNGWELNGSVLSLSHFLGSLRTEARPRGVSIHLRPMSFDLSTWSLSPCLSATKTEDFISTLRQLSPGTFELVSISQPQRTLRPLNASITHEAASTCARPADGAGTLPPASSSSSGRNVFTLSLQMNAFATGGITFVRWQSDTASVVVRHCRFFQTLRLSQGMLEPTSRLLASLAHLTTPECALFVIRSLASLSNAMASQGKPLCEQPVLNSLGWMEMAANGVEGSNCWEQFLNSTSMGSPDFLGQNSNTTCGKPSSSLATNLTKPFRWSAKFPSGQITPREWHFARGSSTPFKRSKSSTSIF